MCWYNVLLLKLKLFSTPHATPVRDGAVFYRRKRERRHADNNHVYRNVAASRRQNVDDFFVDFENWKSVGVHDDLSTAAVTHNKVKVWLFETEFQNRI